MCTSYRCLHFFVCLLPAPKDMLQAHLHLPQRFGDSTALLVRYPRALTPTCALGMSPLRQAGTAGGSGAQAAEDMGPDDEADVDEDGLPPVTASVCSPRDCPAN